MAAELGGGGARRPRRRHQGAARRRPGGPVHAAGHRPQGQEVQKEGAPARGLADGRPGSSLPGLRGLHAAGLRSSAQRDLHPEPPGGPRPDRDRASEFRPRPGRQSPPERQGVSVGHHHRPAEPPVRHGLPQPRVDHRLQAATAAGSGPTRPGRVPPRGNGAEPARPGSPPAAGQPAPAGAAPVAPGAPAPPPRRSRTA